MAGSFKRMTLRLRASYRTLSAGPSNQRALFYVFLWYVILCDRDNSAHGADVHRLLSRARDDYERAFFIETFEEHVHGTQLQRGRIVYVGLRCLGKGCRDLFFRLAQDHARLALTFCLCLA